ncbi:MAG: extracellular solute-binding protein [Candidatus Latescibacterota bacterium]|jgi:ABC-type sugar transport system permease subunit/ABC-type glycerol-3-phosphate transport system substrate-binding protein
MTHFFVWALLAITALPATAEELIVWGTPNDRGLKAALRQFEVEHPGWEVVTSAGASGGMDPQKLMCGIAGGSPPDMLQQDRFSVGEWAARDAFFALDSYVEQSLEQEAWALAIVAALQRGESTAAREPLSQLTTQLTALGSSRQLDLAQQLDTALAGSENAAALEMANELTVLVQGVHAEKFFEACWQEASFGQGDSRRVYAIPNSTDDRALYYNEDLLERAGLVDEHGRAKPPQNWRELKEYAVRLTEFDADGNMTRLGFAPNYGNSWLYIYGWLNGGRFMSEDGLTCTLAEPRIVEALTFMVEIYDALGGVEKVDAFQSAFQSGEFDPFFMGKVAMKIDGNGVLNNIASYAPNLRFSAAPAPAPQGKKSVTWSGGFSWAIPTGSQNPHMAFELMRFLNSDRIWALRHQVASRYAASRGKSYVPSMAPLPHINQHTYETLVAENSELPARIKENYLLFANLMSSSLFRPVTPVGQLLWDEHARAYEKAVRHTYEPQEALARGQLSVQKELDRLYVDDARNYVNWNYAIAATILLVAGLLFAAYWFGGKGALLHQLRSKESLAAYLFVSPWLLGLLLLTAGPILVSIVYSFCRYDVLHAAEFIGFENYRRLFTDDPLFWKSLGNTAYMMLGVPIGMAAGLAIALLLNTEAKGMRFYRTIFYLPAIVPMVASAILWIWVLNPEIGLINSLLRMLGVGDPPNWLQSASWAFGSKSAIILMGLWSAGSGMIIWLAGLKGIPQHLYEAAEIDGAGPWRRFFHVTLPMLSPYIFFNLIMGIIGTMQIFTQAYIMTEGGPDDSTLFYAYYLFNNAFRYFKMGYASALAWILFLFILALTLLQLKMAPRWVHYEAE